MEKGKKLIVFDLDFTLWDAGGTWCDHTTPPYLLENSYVFDADGRCIYLYPDVSSILTHLREMNFPMAVASRTHQPDIARKLLEMFGIRHFFHFEEIYPGSKLQHFEMLERKSGMEYSEMFFFDDEERNVIEVGDLGVSCQHVLGGLNWHEIRNSDLSNYE